VAGEGKALGHASPDDRHRGPSGEVRETGRQSSRRDARNRPVNGMSDWLGNGNGIGF
jgi:hypothetical protein